jgi:3-oxoacyl-[acyl-carrier protein] reductase
MTKILDEASKNKFFESISLKRFGSVKDVAHLVSFLASEKANYITGQTINIDGGI